MNRGKTRSGKVGLPPGSLVPVGRRLSAESKITLTRYDEQRLQETDIHGISELSSPIGQAGVSWIHFEGLPEPALLEELGCTFGLHSLTLEDILNTDQRPKIEDYGDYLYIVLRMFYADGGAGFTVKSEQISIIFGANFIISFEEQDSGTFQTIRERLRNNKARLRKGGPDYLIHALVDTIVDHYFIILESFGERVELLEERLVKAPSSDLLSTLQALKKELILLRKSLWPLREMISGLEHSESALLSKSSAFYFRDIYDHTVHIIDTLETYRDMLSGMLDIYLSSISNRMNEVMKTLTVIATIFMPLTFITGVYGMNFRFIPGLEWRWGFAMVWFVILVIAGGMLFYFHRKKWW